ncbi:hypothetical protein [Nostoc sp. 'Peltigera malacea cyanobiont' DB3992]|uniref:hypothetical protein n=1 Tax=Nostoc sp. 'Peltigera malacea cyanobiont' DB3992 TaxID=1206980 RepID=UPI000C049A21|nr:hypothetical protein [Nostoc sp. 'Peltigera malacea cyanobiont' DB3992]PHM08235.1 hypothetical protein CK516_22025 [Nostoc sp. 'Peltigera malacea cyanobiont' DB3992]
MNVDITPDGTIYGIELLNANKQLGADEQGKLIVVNEPTEAEQEEAAWHRLAAEQLLKGYSEDDAVQSRLYAIHFDLTSIPLS